MVQQLCPKWSGSWDALFPFARDCARSAPPGAVNAAVLVEAHVERSYDADGGYFRRDEVRNEIYEAAARSVNHPDFRPVYGWVYAHNLFAYVFSVMDDYRSAAQSFRAIGNRMARVVWSGYADPVAEFRKVRDTALRKG